jgi:hypothetical protein
MERGIVSRTALAFLIAPLWVPGAALPFAARAFPYPEQRHWIYMTVFIAAVFAYGGAAVFGTPAFLQLRASRRTAFWIAPTLGFVVGVATWLVFIVLFGLSLGNSWSFVPHDLASNSANLSAFLPTGTLGAAVGATLWLITRPDRGSA